MTEIVNTLQVPAWIAALAFSVWIGARAVIAIRGASSNGGSDQLWKGEMRTLIREDHALLAKVVETQSTIALNLAELGRTLNQLSQAVTDQDTRSRETVELLEELRSRVAKGRDDDD